MQKKDLIKGISDKVNSIEGLNYVNSKQISAIIDIYNGIIVDAMKNEDSIRFANGFSIKGSPVEARSQYCAFNGETIEIPSHIVPKLKVTKAFKEEMNGITW